MSEENGLDRNHKGLFVPGNKASTNRGPNKISTKVKEALVGFLELNIDQVQESFDKLKPLEKLQFIANILPYVVPKMQAIQTENNTKLSGGINIRWSEPGLLHPADKGSNGVIQGIQERSEDNSEPGGDPIR